MIKNIALIGIFAVTSVASLSAGTERRMVVPAAAKAKVADIVTPSRPVPQGLCQTGACR